MLQKLRMIRAHDDLELLDSLVYLDMSDLTSGFGALVLGC
jgi:hypothetical protein